MASNAELVVCCNSRPRKSGSIEPPRGRAVIATVRSVANVFSARGAGLWLISPSCRSRCRSREHEIYGHAGVQVSSGALAKINQRHPHLSAETPRISHRATLQGFVDAAPDTTVSARGLSTSKALTSTFMSSPPPPGSSSRPVSVAH